MDKKLLLLPAPRSVEFLEGTHEFQKEFLIHLDCERPQTLLFAAKKLQHALGETHSCTAEIVAHKNPPRGQVGITVQVPSLNLKPQGYELTISEDHILIAARDEAGAFYGINTLIQILGQTNRRLKINDAPDYKVRGVMLDVSRDKVPTMQTLFELIEMLASWKINQLQLYTEHTFAYRDHREVWAEASPFTAQEVLELDAFCRERFIELVPNQNTFGHMERWLRHKRYAHLAETHEVFDTPWGNTMKGPFSLCPLDDGSLMLVREICDELLPHFTSKMFNVGCDETIDVGQGRSKDECTRRGSGRVYLDYLLKIYREVQARDHTMMFWGDIIVEHPDLIRELPRDAIALEWGYESHHPFDDHGAKFAASGVPFYVCPGTSSWCSIGGRTDNALENLLNAAENGLKHGASGYLITDWGDRGHWQPLPVSYIGLAAGAAYSWCVDSNRSLDVISCVSRFAFNDDTGNAGEAAYRMGNVYLKLNAQPPNSSKLFWVLQNLPNGNKLSLEKDEAQGAMDAIDDAMMFFARSPLKGNDANLILREYDIVARLLKHACKRGLFLNGGGNARELDHEMHGIIEDYQQMWLARNREGGMRDSVMRLEKIRNDYKS